MFLREVVGLKEGVPGVVMARHTFGTNPGKWHPHLYALVTDGLFKNSGRNCLWSCWGCSLGAARTSGSFRSVVSEL